MMVGIIPSALVSAAVDIIDDLTSNAPIVTIEPQEKHNARYGEPQAKPDASGFAHFIIKAQGEITEDITVYYATEDLSAIAEAKDYVPKIGSVVLTKDTPEVKISIYTSKCEYSVMTHIHGGYKYVFYNSRSFLVKLTGVTGNAQIDKNGGDRVECALNAEHALEAYKVDSENTVLTPYTWLGKYEIKNFLNTDACDGGESYKNEIPLKFPTHWATDYINSGLDAKLYMSLQNAHIEESWWNSTALVKVTIAGVTVELKGEFHDNEEFGWGPAFLYGVYGVEGTDEKIEDYFNENFEKMYWKDPNRNGNFLTITKNADQMKSAIEAKNIILRKYQYYGLPNAIPNDPGLFYVRLHDEVINWPTISVLLESIGGSSRKLTGGDVSFRLEDITAPKIETKSSGGYAIYHNFNTATAGEKLRISIRFNEPVQVKGKEPYISGKINGIGNGNGTDPYSIKFNYVGGSGTDTLYFESDYSGKYQINSITDLWFTNGKSITDFASDPNGFTQSSGLIIDGFNLDKRSPVISVSSADSKMSAWAKTKSVSVTVSNISEDGTLYYSWTDSTSAPETYTNKISINQISVNGTKTVSIVGNENGSKYLHLKMVSRFGQETTSVKVVNNLGGGVNDKIEGCLGPYNFDNASPTVDESKLLPRDSSNMNEKKYLIPVPKDTGSGFYEIKMYYVGKDGQSNLVKTYNVNSFKSANGEYHDLSFSLKASDVGIGENERGNVTLYFTLTDAIGNTTKEIARHRVTFDTNQYIDLISVVPIPEMADETEIIDDGYTLIYKGNPYPTPAACYTLVMRVLTRKLNGTPIFNVYQNGTKLVEGQYGYATYTHERDENGQQITTCVIQIHHPIASSGYFDFQISVDEGNTTHVSRMYRLYVGGKNGKLDEQINNGTMLVNSVYQLPPSSSFYYMDKNGTIGTIIKELYNGTTLSASFSSFEKALEYVLFNEYRDAYAITLTAELAEALNAGNSSVQKALGEQTIAAEGQVWIRYKSPTWDPEKTPLASDWVFYYYGEGEALDVSNFSSTLTQALQTVSQRIVSRGQAVKLTSTPSYIGGVGNNLVDKNGSPYLSPLQIHISNKRLSEEKRNSTFVNEITFTADTDIYSSCVVINGIEYYLIGNATIPTSARIQYKRIDESGAENGAWMDLVYTPGQRFADAITEAGRYKIRELGVGGISTFDIYIDKEAPMILVAWNDKDGASHTQILTSSSEKEFRAKSFKIVGIDQREYDKYSYIALYNVANSKLQGVYTVSELQGGSVDVSDGNYYMVVSDRSGNSYTMMLHINSTELKCDISENENVRIKFTCNRKDSQIQEFYVKRNGVLVSGKYAQELEFTESGSYEFYVKDIYGNVYGPQVHEFTRVYPEVVWKYRDQTNHYVTYDPQNKTKYFTLGQTTDGVFTISTSTSLKFQIPSNYGYTFIGTAPRNEYNVTDGTVTIGEIKSFQLKVYYQKHPDVYTIYNCLADTSAPIINATMEMDKALPNEPDALRKLIAEGLGVKPGDILIPSSISYSSTETKEKHISNNETVLSDLIKIEISDESGLANIYVYRNGELMKNKDITTSSGIFLNRSGKYLIVAEDTLGNKSEFTFTNGTPNNFTYVVDGLPLQLGLRDFENFDENGNYTDSTFGNELVSFMVAKQTNIFYMISDSNGRKHFVAFDVSGSAVRQVYYTVDEEKNVVLKMSDEALFDTTDSNIVEGKEYAIYEIEELDVTIYATLNPNGTISLTIYSSTQSELTVEARLNTQDGEFHYTKTELSSFSADLFIKTSEGTLQIVETKDLIKLNREFTISTNRFIQDKIVAAEVYYSENNDFGEYGFLFLEDIYEDNLYYKDEGFYLVRLVNEYGNASTFIIHVSYKFNVSAYSEFADGEKIYYSTSYKEAIYSNNKVVFEVYANGVSVQITRNGEEYKPVIKIENGITYITLSETGSYKVVLSDENGNDVERIANIDTSKTSFNEELLVGYNENALKKAEGYTNKKLSVNKELFESELISYLAVQFGDTTKVLYDAISENGVNFDESKLNECIGNMGDGKYLFIARNRYGASWTKTIYYRETPTLILEREIRTGTETEAYDLNKAITVGFWSNSELIFKTDAEYYVFTVNGDKTECPKTISFAGAGQYGHLEYEITYVDEYGFSYSFKAYLVRQDVEIKLNLEKEALDINGVLTTIGDVSVLFTEGATCTYTWNNSEEKIYTLGQKLTRDGTYRFVVSDYAGNMSKITIKKDTTVEFSFIKVNSSTPIQNGGVVNSSKVSFEALNGDSAYIEKVYRNSILQSDFDGTRFSEDGKWEIIVGDKLGNKSYFSFYIISKQKNGFAYTTPYEYHITELWYDGGDGTKISYIKFVNHTDFSSSFVVDENGKYTVVMTSDITGDVSRFDFTVNKNAPNVSLVGCNEGDITINDISVSGCKVGDKIKVYRMSRTGEKLVKEIEVTSLSTKMPTIDEGGEYRIVVESEAGVETELSFVRKHVMNTSGSIFIMIVIAALVVSLFVGLVYRNKSKTDK